MAILFTLKSFCQKSGERKSPKKYLVIYSFLMSDLGRALTSNKLDSGDYFMHIVYMHTVKNRLRTYHLAHCALKSFLFIFLVLLAVLNLFNVKLYGFH